MKDIGTILEETKSMVVSGAHRVRAVKALREQARSTLDAIASGERSLEDGLPDLICDLIALDKARGDVSDEPRKLDAAAHHPASPDPVIEDIRHMFGDVLMTLDDILEIGTKTAKSMTSTLGTECNAIGIHSAEWHLPGQSREFSIAFLMSDGTILNLTRSSMAQAYFEYSRSKHEPNTEPPKHMMSEIQAVLGRPINYDQLCEVVSIFISHKPVRLVGFDPLKRMLAFKEIDSTHPGHRVSCTVLLAAIERLEKVVSRG